jgi:hypothetical protein
MGPRPAICQNSHSITSNLPRTSVGRNLPVFSARYVRMAPDSKTLIGAPPSVGALSRIAGMRLLGESARKSGLN